MTDRDNKHEFLSGEPMQVTDHRVRRSRSCGRSDSNKASVPRTRRRSTRGPTSARSCGA